jgi:hypothetical protein
VRHRVPSRFNCSLRKENFTLLDEKIREKKPGLQKKKIIFHRDNAPAHKSVLAMGKLRNLH